MDLIVRHAHFVLVFFPSAKSLFLTLLLIFFALQSLSGTLSCVLPQWLSSSSLMALLCCRSRVSKLRHNNVHLRKTSRSCQDLPAHNTQFAAKIRPLRLDSTLPSIYPFGYRTIPYYWFGTFTLSCWRGRRCRNQQTGCGSPSLPPSLPLCRILSSKSFSKGFFFSSSWSLSFVRPFLSVIIVETRLQFERIIGLISSASSFILLRRIPESSIGVLCGSRLRPDIPTRHYALNAFHLQLYKMRVSHAAALQ